MQQYRQRTPYFSRFKCAICHQLATHFVCAGKKSNHYMLCDIKKCDFEVRIRTGFFKIASFGLGKV